MYECCNLLVVGFSSRGKEETYRRRVVKVEMALLDTLSVYTLRVGETKQALLQEVATQAISAFVSKRSCVKDILFLVPERKCNVHKTVCVRDTSDTVFTPAVGTFLRHVVRKVCSRVSMWYIADLRGYLRLQASPSALPAISNQWFTYSGRYAHE